MERKVNYTDYEHSYAHALEPKIKTLFYYGVIKKKPARYLKAIVRNVLEPNKVHRTDKEKEFFNNVMDMESSEEIYWYCYNAVNKAKTITANVDNFGNLVKEK